MTMTNTLEFTHFRQVPKGAWRWKFFSPQEIACRGTGRIKIDAKALDMLEALRIKLGKPLIVNSAYRSPEHNRAVKGATRSKHMEGTAFDISMSNHDPETFIKAAREVGFRGIGTYPRSNFVHVDTGPARTWGQPFPARKATPDFAPEAPRAPETISEDTDAKAAIGILGSGGIAAAAEVVAPMGGVLGQLAPVAQTIAVLAVVALGALILIRHLKGR
jgi:zinc D-Ala-D-Ala carboxypeptidase